jgi:glycerol-3-phosphate acyltransferase PlsY
MEWTGAWLLIGSYLLGAIPFGVIVARASGVDILRAGSGNPGATNVWRAVGPAPGLLVFALDFSKGFAPAVAAQGMGHGAVWAFALGMAATLGHLFSPFLGFKGGKGVATGFGMLAGTHPGVALSALGVFLIVLCAGRYVSLASLSAAATIAAFGHLFGLPLQLVIAFAGLAGLLFFKHRGNVARLLAGTERKFEFRRRPKPAQEDLREN